jgi:hypothetical protein
MREIPPTEPQFDKLVRTIASNEPRVTKFKINWEPKPQNIEGVVLEEGAQSVQVAAQVTRIHVTADVDNNKENISNQQVVINTSNKINGSEINENNNSNSFNNYLQNTNSNSVLVNGDDNMVS